MGLLDDAIRQHLELKRRHGADPSDVAKLEHEALGPTARPEPVAPSTPDAAAVTDETVYDEEPSYDEAGLEAEEERPAEPAAPPPEPVAPPPQPVVAEREPPAPEPSPAPLAPAREPEPLRPGGSVRLDDVGERTLDLPAADHEPDPQPDAEHDELEETPEFLQETPEHDRLWFEQKPPRDFDF